MHIYIKFQYFFLYNILDQGYYFPQKKFLLGEIIALLEFRIFKFFLFPLMYIDIYREPSSERSLIFIDVKFAIEYLIRSNLISEFKSCPGCNMPMPIKKITRAANGHLYRCPNSVCRKEISLLCGTKLEGFRLPLNDIFLLIYKWIENSYEKDVCRNVKVSKKSYQNIKTLIIDYILQLPEPTYKLGGAKNKIQVDETVICHGFLHECPSKIEDDFPGVTWLVGIIEENTKDIRLEIVENRSLETFKEIFERNIEPGSTVITDGHRSYPGAVFNINGTHKVVNHSIGFKNIEGFHTNNIENLWSIMKYEVKKRKGILKSNIPRFLKEFKFRYLNLRNRSQSEILCVFSNILDYLFKNQ